MYDYIAPLLKYDYKYLEMLCNTMEIDKMGKDSTIKSIVSLEEDLVDCAIEMDNLDRDQLFEWAKTEEAQEHITTAIKDGLTDGMVHVSDIMAQGLFVMNYMIIEGEFFELEKEIRGLDKSEFLIKSAISEVVG